MFYVYLLKALGSGRLYVGFSKNLKKRIEAHRLGQVITTAKMGDVELIFYEAYKDKSDALRREKFFKTTKGKRTLRLMLRKSLV